MRRFVHGRGTEREEATIPTFVMVANRAHPQYSQRDLERMEQLEREDDSVDSADQQLRQSFCRPGFRQGRPFRVPFPVRWLTSLDGHSTDTLALVVQDSRLQRASQ
jgi:hypothetical protein